jgi:hypothetical protein
MKDCTNDVEDYVLGTKGRARLVANAIEGEKAWEYPREQKRKNPSMYDIEHQELFAGLRSGNIINNGLYMTYSTMMAIMGRMACYTGQTVTWEQAVNSQEKLGPDAYTWGDAPVPPVALPGITKLG